MPAANPKMYATSQPVFAARLTPHRSLGRTGFAVLMAALAVVSLTAGTIFWAAGAWPVAAFMGLDFLLIYLAFKLNYRSGRAYEDISVSREELIVRKVSPAGMPRDHRFNPLWARFMVDRHEEIGITRMQIVSRDTRLAIGAFLNPDDRESFAGAFSTALARAKH